MTLYIFVALRTQHVGEAPKLTSLDVIVLEIKVLGEFLPSEHTMILVVRVGVLCNGFQAADAVMRKDENN